jgi:hypothetical protein
MEAMLSGKSLTLVRNNEGNCSLIKNGYNGKYFNKITIFY